MRQVRLYNRIIKATAKMHGGPASQELNTMLPLEKESNSHCHEVGVVRVLQMPRNGEITTNHSYGNSESLQPYSRYTLKRLYCPGMDSRSQQLLNMPRNEKNINKDSHEKQVCIVKPDIKAHRKDRW
jgi:hypothetical protein